MDVEMENELCGRRCLDILGPQVPRIFSLLEMIWGTVWESPARTGSVHA